MRWVVQVQNEGSRRRIGGCVGCFLLSRFEAGKDLVKLRCLPISVQTYTGLPSPDPLLQKGKRFTHAIGFLLGLGMPPLELGHLVCFDELIQTEDKSCFIHLSGIF